MQIGRCCAYIAVVSLLSMSFASRAAAQGAPHATTVTFDQSVRVPGATLTPGTYIFARPIGNSRIVQVFRADSRRLVTSFQSISDINRHPGTFITFWDVPRGNVPLVRVWYPTGSADGYAFVYHQWELDQFRTLATK